MTDAELNALTALVNMNRELCAADNDHRRLHGLAPAWTSDCLPSEEEKALREELERRGILKVNSAM